MKALAVALAALAATLAVGRRPNVLQARLGPARRGHGGVDRRGHRIRRGAARRSWAAVVVAGGVTGLMIGGPVLAALAAASAGLAVAARTRTAAERLRRSDEVAVCDACLVLAAELRSGAHTWQALSVVGAEWPDLFGVVAHRADVGGDISAALRRAAGPGRSALSAVAAAWEVSERTGAALSDVLTAVADSLRAESAARREAAAQLSTVRVTARLMAVLPVGTLLLLSGGDGAAMRFLVGTPYGLACLTGAFALVTCGLWWVDRLARSATTSSWS